MTRDQAKRLLLAFTSGAIQAFAEGKPIQWRFIGSQLWNDHASGTPYFANRDIEWRPAPEPERKPITPAEAFDLFGAVIHDKDGKRWRVECHDNDGTILARNESGFHDWVSYYSLLTDGWTHNGEPICSRL